MCHATAGDGGANGDCSQVGRESHLWPGASKPELRASSQVEAVNRRELYLEPGFWAVLLCASEGKCGREAEKVVAF